MQPSDQYGTSRSAVIALTFVAMSALAACSSDDASGSAAARDATALPQQPARATPEVGGDPIVVSRAANVPQARARLRPTKDSMTSGVVEFTEKADGKLDISVELAGLAEGKHGLHIHENGDCSMPDGSSAGEHFSPGGRTHGSPTDAVHHAGDLGNVTADERGIAIARLETPDFKLSGQYGIVNRAVIVHADEDDFLSQPSGNSGDRVACGVVKTVEAQPSIG